MRSRFFLRFQAGLILALAFAITAFHYKTPVQIQKLINRTTLWDDPTIEILPNPTVEKAGKQSPSVNRKPAPVAGPEVSISPEPDPAHPGTDPNPSPDPVVDPKPAEVDAEPEDGIPQEIFSLSTRPVFPGCEKTGGDKERFDCFQKSVMMAVQRELLYPKVAVEMRIEGTVFVELVIDKRGEISEVIVLKSPDESLSAEALRAVKSLRRFGPMTPGLQAGRPVACRFRMPVRFALGN